MAAFFGILLFTLQLFILSYGTCMVCKAKCSTDGTEKKRCTGGWLVMLVGLLLASLTAYFWITYYLQGDFAYAYPVGLMEVQE